MNTVPASTTASTMIGYARVSTAGQTLEQQSEALTIEAPSPAIREFTPKTVKDDDDF